MCHIRQNGKTGKMAKFVFDHIRFLGTSDFHRICGKRFLVVKHKKNDDKFGIRKKNPLLHQPCPLFNDYILPPGRYPRYFFSDIMSGKNGKTMSRGYFRKKISFQSTMAWRIKFIRYNILLSFFRNPTKYCHISPHLAVFTVKNFKPSKYIFSELFLTF